MKPVPITASSSFEAAVASVKAGFPSPADDFREKLDLIKLLVQHTVSAFFFRIGGVSMVDADMDEGDIIIVDRVLEPRKTICVSRSFAKDIPTLPQLSGQVANFAGRAA